MTDTGFRWRSASRSVVGNVRKLNEDALLDWSARGLWAVADGMGGHDAGDVASRTVVEALRDVEAHDRFSRFVDDVEDHVLAANRRLYEMSVSEGKVIGCTFAGLLAHGRHYVCVWAGDSRVYRLRRGRLEQLTRDHSQVEEMLERGEIDEAAAETHHSQNVITRAVGAERELYLDYVVDRIEDGDKLLVCSDGLYKELTSAEIGERLGEGDCTAGCAALIDGALARECSDNVSVIVVHFTAAPA